MVVDNFLCLCIYYAVNRHYYGYSFNSGVRKGYGIAILIGVMTFAASLITNPWLSYPVMGALLTGSGIWSWTRLRNRLRS